MRAKRRYPLATLTALLVAACAGGEEAGSQSGTESQHPSESAPLPDVVTITDPGLHPEGIEWDAARGRFLVGSVIRGTVTAVSDDGSHEVLVEDPEVTASIGIHIDAGRDRLYVASSDVSVFQDPAAQGYAHLGAYDLETGERIFLADLGALGSEGRHFANDVTVGPNGLAYVTDSFAPVIYAVTPDGTASVLVEDERLAPTEIGLNGIDVHPDGFLIVAHMGNSELYRVALDGSSVDLIQLDAAVSGDGLAMLPDGGLAVVGSAESGETSEVFVIRSEDGWATATLAARSGAGGATTGAIRGGEIYAVDPRFGDMFSQPPPETFEIRRARFE